MVVKILQFFILILFNILIQSHLYEQSSSSSHHHSSSKSVKILLQSKWSQTPMYLETAEFLADENQDFYWQFLDDLQNELSSTDHVTANWTTSEQQYQSSLRLASKLLRSESKLSILKFSLSLRSYSPKVITFKNIIEDIYSSENGEKIKKCNGPFVELSVPTGQHDHERYICHSGDDVVNAIDNSIKYLQKNDNLQHPLIYSIDHIYPGRHSSFETSPHSITVILYANIGSKSFFRLHKIIKRQIDQGKPIRYIIRHNPASTKDRVALSGYGVELAIKSTEYKAQDDTRVRGEVVESSNQLWKEDFEQSKPDEIAGFIFSKLKARNAELTDKLNEFRDHLMDQEKEIATLKVWELQEISLQAATKVLSVQKEKALSVLRDISQNFPSVARSLVKIHVEPELKREIVHNQNYFYHHLNLATSDTALFINGLYHDMDSVDVFTLLETMKREYYSASKLHNLLNGDHDRIKKLDAAWERGQQQQLDFQMDIRDGSVFYINDIEQDRMYRSWPSSLQEMLRPTYPGILRNIRRNMYHLILIIDPSRKESFDMLRMAESFYIHKAPVRIGLVFDVDDNQTTTGYQNAGVACLEAYNYISQQKSPYEALSFITDVIAYATSQNLRDLEPDDIINQFKSKISKSDADDVFGSDSSYDVGRKLSRDFLDRTGLEHGPKAMLNGVLLKESHLQADYFEEAVLSEIMRQSSQFQKAIYKAELNDEDDVLEWLMSKKTVMTRLNRVIFGLDESNQKRVDTFKYLDLISGQALPKRDGTDDASLYYTANINDLQATLYSQLKYINSKKDCNPVTVWLASDFLTMDSRTILLSALNHLKENSRYMRLSLVYTEHNPITIILESALSTITSSTQLLNFLTKVAAMNYDDWEANIEQISQLISDEFRKAFLDRYAVLKSNKNSSPFLLHQTISSRLFGISSSDDFALILNGKIFKVPVRSSNNKLAFNEDDFALMERYAQNFWSEKILSALNDDERNSGTRKCSDLVLRICSVLLSKASSSSSSVHNVYKQRYEINNIHDEHSALMLEPRNPSEPFIELTAILDPLTRGAQKISPILATFYEVFNTRIKIHFNAVEKHSDMPLKLFYRFVLDQEPKFDSNSGSLINPVALFQSMPKTPLFTLGMSVPENWMVEAVEAIYDLDNIHLAQVDSNVVGAVFELEHLLVEGHCFEQSSGSPPRGLQFTLGTQTKPTIYDTIVMANLGYFQLKASPGIWLLRLRQGRSTDIYTIVSHDNTDQIANTTEVIPIVSSFRSLVIKIRVNKKPGKQNEELLYDSDDNSAEEDRGWFSSWNSDKSNRQNSGDKSKDSSGEDEDSKRINIFSVASGHLYERLLRIMMLSVLKHTQTPVKFWFLKNYLSPKFKQVLPHMANRYGFEYELVQYKWPRWLHQQTEKQRIIWGYKILFLDVLFPLDVKKIIFVDADQVVRTDLVELRDLDLEGAPYGYTPFCDSRKDMDGFRFWKSGYWATHLHGRKYHISALYVVDLQKFRRIAAGDRLRGQYQGLSQDPNSLSNLDQDLPNNMIHQVAIKSLPQEWLWCETWCDDISKQKAKTIDLCNNPKTKEPKLTAARRIVAEWEKYDQELKQFLDELSSSLQKNQTKNMESNADNEINLQPKSSEHKAHSSDHQEL